MELIINGCNNCPACQFNDASPNVSWSCGILQNGKAIWAKEPYSFIPDTPDWCPIKKESVILKFKTD